MKSFFFKQQVTYQIDKFGPYDHKKTGVVSKEALFQNGQNA